MLTFFKRFLKKTPSTTLASPSQKKGYIAEQQVAEWLRNNNYTIITTNFRCKRGEIDIIARNNSVLCFVEVKARTTDFLTVAELVPAAKQRKIIQTAYYFLALHPHPEHTYRFDIAYVQGTLSSSDIRYLSNAFSGE